MTQRRAKRLQRSPCSILADPVPGVPARGDEPSVVLLGVAGQSFCSGVLVASDVVMTARHCVSALRGPVECPDGGSDPAASLQPGVISVRVGDDALTATERGHARAVLVPPADDLCGADLAFVLLDEAIDDVAPLAVRATGAATGDRVRTVGFDMPRADAGPGSGPVKLLRDHVSVAGTSSLELTTRETSAGLGGGGAALDESSGDVVGIASRVDPTGPAPGSVYVRADAFLPLFEAAIAESAFGLPSRGAHLLKSLKGPADMGANCIRGSDCAAGACVAVDASRYCSRVCGPRD